MTSDNHVTGQDGFVPCPLCKQYSHSIGEDQLAEAFLVFQSMWSHRDDGIPTKWCFNEKARDAAQILMAAARQSPSTSEQASVHSPDEVERLRSALERLDRNFDLLLRGKPVRDVAETKAEVQWALRENSDAEDARAAIAALQHPAKGEGE